MPEHSAQILSRNLVRFAESLDNTDTTTITASLSRLLGFVQLAIESIIAERSSASVQTRFSYHSKAAAWEREAGLSDFDPPSNPGHNLSTNACARCGKRIKANGSGDKCECGELRETIKISSRRNVHPTIKPIALTEYLARLILPPALDEPRRLLVPFAGSGSEMIGALLAGWDVVTGIEQSPEYVALAEARLAWWARFGSYEQARAAWDAEQGEQARREAERAAGVEQLSLAFANEGGTI